jgi:hypothetical protein
MQIADVMLHVCRRLSKPWERGRLVRLGAVEKPWPIVGGTPALPGACHSRGEVCLTVKDDPCEEDEQDASQST